MGRTSRMSDCVGRSGVSQRGRLAVERLEPRVLLDAGSYFISGRTDISASVAGGSDVENASRIDLAEAGISYNNLFDDDGVPNLGDAHHAIGVVPVSSAEAAGSIRSLDTGLNLVAVYAFKGVLVPAEFPLLRVSFDPSVGGEGFVGVYERTSAPPLDVEDPSTWVNDIHDLTDGLVAALSIADRPVGVLQGIPTPHTEDPALIAGPDVVNTAFIDALNPFAPTFADFKLSVDDTGTLFDDWDVRAPRRGNFTQIDSSLLLHLDLQITPFVAQQPDVSELNEIFEAFTGVEFATIGDGDGTDYEPLPLPFTALNGDASELILGGFAIPGGQFLANRPLRGRGFPSDPQDIVDADLEDRIRAARPAAAVAALDSTLDAAIVKFVATRAVRRASIGTQPIAPDERVAVPTEADRDLAFETFASVRPRGGRLDAEHDALGPDLVTALSDVIASENAIRASG